MMKNLLVGMCVVFLASCCTPSYRDISYDAEYVHVVGEKYRTLEEFFIYGYSKDSNYETVDGYVIINEGIGGREILTKDPFPIGSVILVKRIMDCEGCLSSSKRIIVEIISDESYSGEFIKLRDTGNVLVSHTKGGVVEMNPQLFESLAD